MTQTPSPSSKRSSIVFVCLSLLLFSFGFGYLSLTTYAEYRPQEQFPDWQGAQPITPETASAMGYFRRQLMLVSSPARAYLLVSGTDEVKVYVNETMVGAISYFDAKPADILDITRYLIPGKNLIAAEVENRATDAVPELRMRVELQQPDGTRQTLLTDRQWRAAGVEAYSQSRRVLWNSPDFVDLDWPSARIAHPPDNRPIHPYVVPEMIYRDFPEGYWIRQASDKRPNATFMREFEVYDEVITGAWLGISTAGNYSIMLNDLLLYSSTGSLESMVLFDIGPYINQGQNRLLIQLESETPLSKLAVSGLVTTVSGEVNFSSDGRWRILLPANSRQKTVKDEAVIVMDPVQSGVVDSSMSLNFKGIETPMPVLLQGIERFVILSMLIGVVTTASLVLLHLLGRLFAPLPLWQDLEILASPVMFVGMLIGLLLIVSNDIRIEAQMPFQPPVLISLLVLLLLWEGFILVERFVRERSGDD